ncbi:transcription termination/antitermination protein NusG [Kaistia defluvii]|uniref:Transcription antitermination factor NusG n=1 Tax=Kaistia defluvii TaxID=410841 RepID=A0ABV2R2T8_9HYPH
MTTSNWYVGYLRAGATRPSRHRGPVPAEGQDETVVERALADEGFGAYLPRVRKELRHHRTKKIITRRFPLLPGYIFVTGGDREPNWMRLKACEGISGVLSLDGRPWPIADAQVDTLKQAEADLLFDDTHAARVKRGQEGRTRRETTAIRFHEGCAITLTEGPFSGLPGVVVGVTTGGLIRAIVEVFRQKTPMEIPPEWVEIKEAA